MNQGNMEDHGRSQSFERKLRFGSIRALLDFKTLLTLGYSSGTLYLGVMLIPFSSRVRTVFKEVLITLANFRLGFSHMYRKLNTIRRFVWCGRAG